MSCDTPLAGPLAHIGRTGQPPSVPLNLIGDFGGGSVFLVLGMVVTQLEMGVTLLEMVVTLLEVARGGGGQVVDAAMSDGKWLAVGAIEPQLHAEFMAGIGLADAEDLPDQMDRDRWPR